MASAKGEPAATAAVGLKAAALAGQRTRIADYVALTKPRIMALLLITAFCGMVVAAHGWPAWGLAVQTLGGLALSVGGAHAVNMWFDADIDGLMDRTRARPIPAGRMAPEKALWMGVGLGIISFIWLWTRVNPWAAGLAFCGYLYYVLVYTMWLKRTTPQNIVIGGGAGAFPPLVGWAAVTGHLGWAAWVLFGIVFLWTPPHFWALALYRRREYARAAVPMLPVTHGPRATKGQMIGYAAALLPVSWLLARVAPVGWLYLVVAATAGLALLGACMRLWFEPDDRDQWARRTFFLSLWYLTAVFGAMVADVVLRA